MDLNIHKLISRCPRYYCEDGAVSDEFLPAKAHSEPPGLSGGQGQCLHRYSPGQDNQECDYSTDNVMSSSSPDILVSSGEVTVWKTRIVVNNSVQ